MKPLPDAIPSDNPWKEITIIAKISITPKAVADNDFPLFRAFVLSPKSDELFIKITKNSIISLSTGDRFAANITGYLVHSLNAIAPVTNNCDRTTPPNFTEKEVT